MTRGNILVIADKPARFWLENILSQESFQVRTADDWKHGALKLLEPDRTDLVICDLTLNEKSSLRFLQYLKGVTKARVIMLTAGEEVRKVVRAMDYGAYDCIEKPIERADLLGTIVRALNPGDFSSTVGINEPADSDVTAISRLIIGHSQPMRKVRSEIVSFVPQRKNIFLQGESGTGKRLISRVIHETGVTAGHPFFAVDLPAIPEQQLEKVLFGEVRGRPVVGMSESKGLFELASTGTLLLNDISEISQDFQEKLLSVLNNKRFEPVGGKKAVPVRARLISTSKKDLSKLIRKGEFSQELYLAMASSSVIVPALRERVDDIPELVTHFLRRINRELHKNVNQVPGECMQLLQAREWPGNISELRSTLSRALSATDGNMLKAEHLRQGIDEIMN